MVKKNVLAIIAVVLIIAILLVIYSSLYLGHTIPSSSSSSSISTLTTNGHVVYVYSTLNQTSIISANVNETFGVQLSSNAGSTGYDWNASSSSGIQYLNYTIGANSSLAGGSQVRVYWFRVTESGSQTITLQDKRQFAPYDVAASIRIQVTVSPNNSSTTRSSTGAFQSADDTLAGGSPQLAMLSYNFQVNSTSGSLFVVFKNYSNSTTHISTIRFDNKVVSNSSIEFTNDCSNFKSGSECGVTLIFAAGALQLPADNSIHSLAVLIGIGDQFDFAVTAGVIAEATCTFTSSC